MKENPNKKKNLIILGVFCVLALVLGTTLAYWSWTSSDEEKTNVVVEVAGATINYEDGDDITNNNLIPTSTKEKGISKDITISSTSNVNLNMNLEVVELADELKEESFKYEIYKSGELVKGGNLANANVADVLPLLEGVEITSDPVVYTLYIWIDGNMDNPNDMYNKNFKFHLSANASQKNTGPRTIVDEIKNQSKGSKTEVSGISPKVLTYKEHSLYVDKYKLSNLEIYYTYASDYTFDNKTGKYTLTNPTSGKYNSIYGQLAGKYIVSYSGSSSSEVVGSTNINQIYKIKSADANGLIEYEYLAYEGDTLDLSDTGVWEAPDDYGTSYYYRGNVENNYVQFGEYKKNVYFGYQTDISRYYKTYDSLSECNGASDYNKNCKVGIESGTPMYFRIIRIDGNDNIRLIYDGTSVHSNDESTLDKQFGRWKYNTNYDDNAYVGYIYGSKGASSYANTHANNTSSDIKTKLEKWYSNNLANYSNVIATDTVFCNDRSISNNKPSSDYNNLGYAKNATVYRWKYGPWSSDYPQQPRLTCPQLAQDGMSVSTSTKGNKKLSQPVGLLTTDEAVFVGGWDVQNRNYYLYNGDYYWTMSSSYFNGTSANVRVVHNNGGVNNDSSSDLNDGLRPVISLKPSTIFSGSGTKDDPYVVVE